MTDIEMYLPKGGVQGHAGQATMVEASRAMEEVRAQVILARQFPRDMPQAIARIKEMFEVKAMADRAFYSYPKGKGTVVSGSTIHLAKGVAQAWGNLTYGIDELSRTRGQSEMRAWAWDLETNQRVSTTFIVEHAMDVSYGDGRKDLTDLRSIYENNANMANRRLRAQIESVIPAYVLDIAKDIATATLRGTGSEPLAVRIDKAVRKFAELGVDAEQIEKERGRPAAKWTEIDLGHLRILLGSINRGEISLADAFPPRDVTADEARPDVPVPAAPRVAPEPEAAPEDPWQDAGADSSWPEVAQPGGGS